jgi:RNA polymerase sigma factor (sigma-70 family)
MSYVNSEALSIRYPFTKRVHKQHPLADPALTDIIEGCQKGRESSQKAFYERFYGYALSVCLAYANDREDAREMLNDGFMKAFKGIKDLQNQEVLLPWLRRIMVNTAIDYHRKSLKRGLEIPAEKVPYLEEPYLNDESVFAQLSAEHILDVLHRLPVPYRMVFSLYVLEGYSHREIAGQLNITESTSRSHLTEANRRMRQELMTQNKDIYARTKR